MGHRFSLIENCCGLGSGRIEHVGPDTVWSQDALIAVTVDKWAANLSEGKSKSAPDRSTFIYWEMNWLGRFDVNQEFENLHSNSLLIVNQLLLFVNCIR
jgi:hypothetical protein